MNEKHLKCVVLVPKQDCSIRSFVRREGRITSAQARALQQLWPQYGLSVSSEPLNFSTVFGRQAPTLLEIGFGMGESFLQTANANPDINYLGIEVFRPGVGKVLIDVARQQLMNVRVFCADAVTVLNSSIAECSLDAVQLFFPDPWPKRRHHKRRLVQAMFIALLVEKLKPQGTLHLATDWQDYAEHMMYLLTAHPQLKNTAGSGNYLLAKHNHRLQTKFELRGKALGYKIWDLLFSKESIDRS